jgi:ribosomal protein L31
LGQEQLFPLNGARMVFQVFRDQETGASGAYMVLTVSIQESVLQQYESICESVGLIPYDVGVTSLKLLDLWNRVSNESRWLHGNVLWVNVSDRALTTIVCRRGRPMLYRCKLLGEEISDASSNPDMLNKVLEECSASLEVCHQRHPSVTIDQAVICAEGEVSALRERIEGELQLSVGQLDWKSVESLGCVAKGNHQGMTSLAALAGLP